MDEGALHEVGARKNPSRVPDGAGLRAAIGRMTIDFVQRPSTISDLE
jgi:hypothetical protein